MDNDVVKSLRDRLKDLNTKAYYLLVALSFIYRINPTLSLKWAFTLTAFVAVLPVQDYIKPRWALEVVRALKILALIAALVFTVYWVHPSLPHASTGEQLYY